MQGLDPQKVAGGGPLSRSALKSCQKTKDKTMRLFLIAAIAISAFTATMTFATTDANALTQTAPSVLREAVNRTNFAQDVRWVCRYLYNGSHCWWAPGDPHKRDKRDNRR